MLKKFHKSVNQHWGNCHCLTEDNAKKKGGLKFVQQNIWLYDSVIKSVIKTEIKKEKEKKICAFKQMGLCRRMTLSQTPVGLNLRWDNISLR